MRPMISKQTSFPFFVLLTFLIFLIINPPMSFYHTASSQSRFGWLRPGAYATYAVGINTTRPTKDAMVMGFIFDDYGRAWPVLGTYSWRCIEANDKQAKLQVEVNVTAVRGGGVSYVGKEFYEIAKMGNLSFVKRVPMDQAVGNVELINISDVNGGYYGVLVRGPIYIFRRIVVTVDLDTSMLLDDGGNPWGRWVMWIDALKYPLRGSTLEPFIMNYLNTTVYRYVMYNNGTRGWPRQNTTLGVVEKYFVAGGKPIENEALTKYVTKSGIVTTPAPSLLLSYIYESRTGVLLRMATIDYMDDILFQKLGVVWTHGTLTILEANIPFEQDSGAGLSPYLPYLALLGISAIITTAYLVRKIPHRKSIQLKIRWNSDPLGDIGGGAKGRLKMSISSF